MERTYSSVAVKILEILRRCKKQDEATHVIGTVTITNTSIPPSEESTFRSLRVARLAPRSAHQAILRAPKGCCSVVQLPHLTTPMQSISVQTHASLHELLPWESFRYRCGLEAGNVALKWSESQRKSSSHSPPIITKLITKWLCNLPVK